MTDDEYLTIAAAAKRFRVLPNTLHKWRGRGVVRSLKIRHRVYVHTHDVADAERALRQKPHTGATPRERRATPATTRAPAE
ncbi:hypothetical protein [Salana multivorans]